MPGTIVKRNNSYALVLYAGKEAGKKRYRWLTFKTYEEAQAAQGELASHTLAHSAGCGMWGNPRERLGPYLRDWIERQKPRLAQKTHTWYSAIVEQIAHDALGTIPLGKLSPRAFESYYERKRKSGLSTTTVLHHHRLLHTALRDAERQDLIIKNPVATARAPRRARVRLEVWSEAQTLLFLSEAKSSSVYYPLYLFLVGTGARIGEALALTWSNVSGDGVSIDQDLQWLRGGGFALKEPKTDRSRRYISVSPEILQELQSLRARQDALKVQRVAKDGLCEHGPACQRRLCPKWHDLGLVFTQRNGKPLHIHNIRLRDLHPLCTRLGLPYRRAIHNIRHAHGSYLLQRGVSVKVVQERLGHTTAQFTLGTYAHVLQGMQEQAARAVSAMLSQPMPKPANPLLVPKEGQMPRNAL